MRNCLRTVLLLAACLFQWHAAQAAEKLRSFEPESFRQILATEKGKPFVIMVWSLDCEYCEASFHALAEAKRARKLDVITIATDRIDSPENRRLIQKKLDGAGLTARRWAFGSAPPESLRYAIDPKWRGEMPRSYWFNAQGERTAHSGVITPELISKLAGQ